MVTGCRDCSDWIVTRTKTRGVSCEPCVVVRKRKNNQAWRAAVRNGTAVRHCQDCGATLRRRKVNLTPRCRECAVGERRASHGRIERVRRYGITVAQFDAMLEAQGGRCAICRSDSPSNGGRDWSIDHDHACCPEARSCGSCVRGILCNPCNGGLGSLGDDPARLRTAAAYLERVR